MGALAPLSTLEEYEARWGTVEESERGKVEAALEDATGRILAEMPGYVAGADPVLDHNMASVCRDMVHRAMVRPLTLEGVTQYQQTAGSLSASLSLSNPDGALYLSKADRRMLGLDDGMVVSVPMGGGACQCP